MHRLRLTTGAVIFVLLVFVDDLSGSPLVVQRVQDLVETRIALLVVEEIDELHDTDGVGLSVRTG